MKNLDQIKKEMEKLYKKDPSIHITVSIKRPRVHLTDVPATITGVYPHLFRVEDTASGTAEAYMLSYNDIVTGEIRIRELPD